MSTQKTSQNTIEQDPKALNFRSDPYTCYAQWHARESALYWTDYKLWCVLSYESVNRCLRDKRLARLPPADMPQPQMPDHLGDFARAEEYSLLAMEPPHHTRLRKLVNRAFMSRQVGRMSPLVHARAHACIDTFAEESTAELLRAYATPIAVNVITRLLGVPASMGEQLVSWSHDMVKVYTLTQSFDEEVRANRAAAEFQQYLATLIAEKRKRPADDLLSHLLALRHADQPIRDEEIISVTILLLNAGHEATVHQLGNAVLTLLQQYPQSDRQTLLTALGNDVTADAIVAECLRYAAPLHLFTRYAQQPITLDGGVHIERGEKIALLLAAANRCPRQFSEPERFNPQRSDAAHLSLGAGIHYCVGAQLAKLELRIALQVLFERLPALALSSQPQYQDTYHFHGLEALHVQWQ